MGQDNVWLDTLRRIGPMAPTVLIWILGIVIAFARWKKHPGVSAAALLACNLAMLQVAIREVQFYWIQNMRLPSNPDEVRRDLDRFILLASLLNHGLTAFTWALMLLAAFGWRSHPGAVFAHVDHNPKLSHGEGE